MNLEIVLERIDSSESKFGFPSSVIFFSSLERENVFPSQITINKPFFLSLFPNQQPEESEMVIFISKLYKELKRNIGLNGQKSRLMKSRG